MTKAAVTIFCCLSLAFPFSVFAAGTDNASPGAQDLHKGINTISAGFSAAGLKFYNDARTEVTFAQLAKANRDKSEKVFKAVLMPSQQSGLKTPLGVVIQVVSITPDLATSHIALTDPNHKVVLSEGAVNYDKMKTPEQNKAAINSALTVMVNKLNQLSKNQNHEKGGVIASLYHLVFPTAEASAWGNLGIGLVSIIASVAMVSFVVATTGSFGTGVLLYLGAFMLVNMAAGWLLSAFNSDYGCSRFDSACLPLLTRTIFSDSSAALAPAPWPTD